MDDISILKEIIDELELDSKMVEVILNRQYTVLSNQNEIIQLDLTGLGMKYIPDKIAELDELRVLDLSDNKIMEFTPFLFDLQNLEALYLYENPFKIIPPSLEDIYDVIYVEAQKLPLDQQKNDLNEQSLNHLKYIVRVESEEEKSKIEILLSAIVKGDVVP